MIILFYASRLFYYKIEVIILILVKYRGGVHELKAKRERERSLFITYGGVFHPFQKSSLETVTPQPFTCGSGTQSDNSGLHNYLQALVNR